MSIKNNLRAGIAFLIFLTIASSGLAAFYLYQLSKESKAILKYNYDSLVFSKNIDEALDLPNIPIDVQQQIIAKNIKEEQDIITEPGEKAFADTLYQNFIKFRKATQNHLLKSVLRANMKIATYGIMKVNMNAIEEKNETANNTASRAIFMVAIMDIIYVIIAILFYIQFPEYIERPIRELTTGITEIANKNYNKRLNFTSRNEFYSLANAFNKMAGKLYDYEHTNQSRIRFEKLRIEAIVKNVTDAIIGFDENHIIIFANPVASKLLGTEESELVGRGAIEVSKENELFRKLIAEKERSKDFKLYLDGSESYFSNELFEIYSPEEKVVVGINRRQENLIGYFILLKNITRFYQLDEAKTNFIATISHELKTPIGSQKLSLKLLANNRYGDLSVFQQELIKHIDEDCERLLKITSELLDMGQVETGKILLNFSNTQPQGIINYSLDAVKTIAEQKGIHIRLNLENNIPEIWADPDKTTWVLINFLSNAIKYSHQDTNVDLQIKIFPIGFVEFLVIDSGRGIQEVYLPRVFERYFKVPDMDSASSGTGLGLAIAKDFIEGQGGKIGVSSTFGEGSVFYFQLPISRV